MNRVVKFSRKIFFASLVGVILVDSGRAMAYIFNEHVYGRMKVFGMYDLQSTNIKDISGGSLQNYGKVNHSLFVGAGYNFYFNSLFENVHPFVGLEMAHRLVGTNSDYKDEPYRDTGLRVSKSYKELFYTHFKAGTKILVDNITSVTPYGIIGFNVDEVVEKLDGFNSRDKYVNLSLGFGAEYAIYDRYYVGLEYRYTATNAGNYTRVNNHNVSLKVGFEFL